MEDGLPPVGARVDEHAVAGLVHTFLGSQPPGYSQHVTHQRFVIILQIIQGFDMLVGDDQEVSRSNGMRITKRRDLLVAMARKLIVSLWRYVTVGLVPEGAVLKV